MLSADSDQENDDEETKGMTKGKVVLLGLGMQGKAVLDDLVKNTRIPRIVVADNSSELTSYLSHYPMDRISGYRIDAANETELIAVMQDADVVIESLPATFALPVGKLAVKLGVNLVSSIYFRNPGEQDAEKIARVQVELRELDQAAKEQGVIILNEFGMDPGIDLVVGAKALKELDDVQEFYSYGAGFPAPDAANNPLQYKFTWSIIGVIRSYFRPAKIISGGKVVEITSQEIFAPPNRHTLDLPEIGSPLECYPNGNSVYYAELFGIKDSIREMARYSCRWPGHCAFWEIMAKCGFLNEEPIKLGDTLISPVQFTAALLGSQKQFYFTEQEQDIAVIRIDVRGTRQGKKTHIIYQLIDRRDLKTGFTAMQRTVGFTMSLGAQLILERQLQQPGLLSPLNVPYDLVTSGLEKHGIHISRQELPWGEE
jgi:lysine 6-dehydrogenase